MKRILLLWLLTSIAAMTFAQERMISGKFVDRDTKEPVMQTTVQLLKTDSSFVTGAISNEEGVFYLKAPENGKYLLRITSVGYTTTIKKIEMAEDHDLAMGTIVLGADAVMLKGATVTAQAMKVVAKEDTFIYNSAAYRTPEGSVVEELVKMLPGAQVGDDGSITVNGKKVSKVRVDGKEFMTGDTQTAMKNLPTSIVEKIKVYDEKSDLARVTGIDDGNEQTVLDFGLKRGMNRGMFGNVDLGIGTHDRYAARGMGAYMKDQTRLMGFLSANNVNDQGFPGGGGRGNFGRGRNGLNASKMLGLNFNYDKKDKLELNGSVRWNHSDSDTRSKNSSENFVSTTGAFSNSLNQSYGRSDSWNAQMKLEWKPDTMTNIMFRPNFSYSKSDGRSWNNSGSFNEDPYEYAADPLDAEAINEMAGLGLVVNARNNNSISYSDSKRVGGSLQVNRKLNTTGRNITLRAEATYNDSEGKSLSTSNVHLYQVKDRFGNDSTYQTNRYNLTPTKNWNYTLQTTYSEPLWKATFLQFSYKFNYSYSKRDRSTYDFSNLGEDFFRDLTPRYRDWNSYLSRLEQPYEEYIDHDRSKYSEYRNYTHDIELMFRMIRAKYQFNVGVMLQPQTSKFVQDYLGVYTDTVRHVTNFTPTLRFRYNFSKQSRLQVDYRGTTSQPSMDQLLEIVDDSDPLNISVGNRGLKPAFTNNFNLFYNNYKQYHMQFFQTYANFSTTRNSISNLVTYDEKTGGRTTRPENINGNWNARAGITYNVAIDTMGVWNVNTSTDYGYTNSVGYVSLDRMASSQKNTTRSSSVSERLAASFRPSWETWSMEIELDGSFTFDHSRNKLQSQSNLDTWRFAYGGRAILTAPWGTSLSTDMHMNSRRGYNDKSMNTNELVWNAQLSQGFLKGKPLTVMLQFYDILSQQSNFSRTINAMQRSDTEYNAINSYAMLHVVYRLNLFGSKDARREMRGRRDGGDGPGFGGPPSGNRQNGGRGGFGGGRPPGGGGFGGPMM